MSAKRHDKTDAPRHTRRCDACRRRFSLDLPDAYQWEARMRHGRPVALLCPNCQTPEDKAWSGEHSSSLDIYEAIRLNARIQLRNRKRGGSHER